jgi:transcription initiation factor IIF auxiliary subunit
MNIGLIILVTSLFWGAEDNNTGQPNEIKNPNYEPKITNEEVDKNNISSNQSDEEPQIITVFNESVNKINSSPTIQGEPRKKINQDEYYSFTPLVNDPENDRLVFDISKTSNP